MITNENGMVTSRKDFMAYGEEAASANRVSGSGGNGYGPAETRKDYTGYEKDLETGLEYAQARYYNPTHGRYTSIDPMTASATIRDPQTFNRYSYVLNSPFKFVDPLGLISQNTGANGGRAWCSTCQTTDEFGGGFVDPPTAAEARESHTSEPDNTPATQGTSGDQHAETQIAQQPDPPSAPADQNADPPPPPPGQTPQFADLWKFHPGNNPIYVDPKTGEPPPGYEHQCAMGMSYALIMAGVNMSSYKKSTITITFSATDGNAGLGGQITLATDIYQLKDWVLENISPSRGQAIETYTNKNWNGAESGRDYTMIDNIIGRTGIIVLIDNWRNPKTGAIRGHIDVWNKTDMARGERKYISASRIMYFIPLD